MAGTTNHTTPAGRPFRLVVDLDDETVSLQTPHAPGDAGAQTRDGWTTWDAYEIAFEDLSDPHLVLEIGLHVDHEQDEQDWDAHMDHVTVDGACRLCAERGVA